MNRIHKLILCFFFFGIALMSLGCQPEGIIPRDDMVTLLSEFYKADASIEAASASAGRIVRVDSLRVYRPIVEQHGYTKEMFRASLEYYMHRPDEMEKIFKRVNTHLKKEAEKMSDVYADDGRIQEEQEDVLDEPEDIREGVEPEIEKPEELKLEKPEELKLDKPVPVEEREDPEKKVERKKPGRKKITKKDMKRLEEVVK